jgi:quercetin 2,3-dioxygenase
MMSKRQLQRVIASVPTSDGAGVKLRRSLGSGQFARLDPFLMLDEFYSDNPEDYIAGFPDHPHRGFETVTYMLEGHMLHRDHLGNTGNLGPGSVQWMTAGHGVIHSEMPQQKEGRMRGFQLWINLPAREKMKPAAYRDIPADEVPQVSFPGGEIKVIAGTLTLAGRDTTQVISGPVNGPDDPLSTDPVYWDLRLAPNASVSLPLPDGHQAMVYLYEGQARIGNDLLPARSAGVLGSSGDLALQADGQGARLLVLAGKPIGEPVVQYGPFVMNTREEIDQAIADYRSGRLTLAV